MKKMFTLHPSDGMTIKKQTPMHLAGAAGQKATCVKLLELDVRCKKIELAILDCSFITFSEVENFQAMIDPNDDLDQKPIHLSAQNDHTHLVQLFLENRPSLVSSTTKDGNTLAHLAAKKGSVDVLKAMFAVDKVGGYDFTKTIHFDFAYQRLLLLGRGTDSTTIHLFTWRQREAT